MKDHILAVAPKCPACDAELRGAFNTNGDRKPRDGDPTLCGGCRALLVFAGDPVDSLRRPTADEERKFLANADVQRAIAALSFIHGNR